MPWIPAPSKIPIQRALIGFEGPGGIDCPASEPAQSDSGTCQVGFSSFSWIVVEAFRRFEAFLADGDGVGLGQLQVLPEPQRVGRPVERQVGRVLLGDLFAGHLRLHRVRAGGDRVVGVGVEHRGVELPGEQVVAQLAPVLGRDDASEFGAGRLRPSRPAVRRSTSLGDLADEAVDRRLRVGDVGREPLVDARRRSRSGRGAPAGRRRGSRRALLRPPGRCRRAASASARAGSSSRRRSRPAASGAAAPAAGGARRARLRLRSSRRRRRRRSSRRRRSCRPGSCRRRRRRRPRGASTSTPTTIAICVFRPIRGSLGTRIGRSDGYLSPVRSKDEVRKEVWKAMDREGVSRFPGAEGRIPNFAGARAGRREARRQPRSGSGRGRSRPTPTLPRRTPAASPSRRARR